MNRSCPQLSSQAAAQAAQALQKLASSLCLRRSRNWAHDGTAPVVEGYDLSCQLFSAGNPQASKMLCNMREPACKPAPFWSESEDIKVNAAQAVRVGSIRAVLRGFR